MNEKEAKKQRAQSWCFENGITEAEARTTWDNAINQENYIAKNLAGNGYAWWWLPPHLLQQLIERYR